MAVGLGARGSGSPAGSTSGSSLPSLDPAAELGRARGQLDRRRRSVTVMRAFRRARGSGCGLAEIGALGHEQRLVRDVGRQAGLAQDRAVALALEAERQVLAAALDDPALGQHVDEVGGDVVQQALVVRDQQDAEVRVEHRVDALGDDPQGVDVEARVGLVEDRHLRLEHRHLEHLEALLLAAREALVDVARSRTTRPSAAARAWPRIFLRKSIIETPPLMASVGSMSGFLSMPWSFALSALRMKLATLRPGIAVGYWKARNIPSRARLSGLSFRMSRPRHVDLAAGHDVRRVAHQRVGERRLARAVRAHDRVDLARPDLEVDALEDLVLRARRSARRCRPRMTSRSSASAVVPLVAAVAVVCRSRWRQGSFEGWRLGGSGLEGDGPLRHEVGEGHAVERAGDRVADADPEQVDGARRRSDRRPGRGPARPWRRSSARAGPRGRAAPRSSGSLPAAGPARSRRGRRAWRRRGRRRGGRTRAARGTPGACPRRRRSPRARPARRRSAARAGPSAGRRTRPSC